MSYIPYGVLCFIYVINIHFYELLKPSPNIFKLMHFNWFQREQVSAKPSTHSPTARTV